MSEKANSKYEQLRMKNVRHKYYAKDEHKSLNGHTIHADMVFLNERNQIVEKHVILTNKDLFITALKKLDYMTSKA